MRKSPPLRSANDVPLPGDNKKQFFEWLGKELGYISMEQWYDVTREVIQKHGGAGLLRSFYNDSPAKALQEIYPEHNWMPWKFRHVTKGLWDKRDHQKQFFEWLGKELGYHSMDNWYSVTREDIDKHGGSGLLNAYFGNSPSRALQEIYPEHNWMPWKFLKIPKGQLETLQSDLDKKIELLDWLSGKLSIRELDDWYRISLNQIANFFPIRYALWKCTDR